jgi:2-polyprenyl-3-methyl-5-hydroxy-6-metoxy-1,4-benzoquinol methylase
VSRFHPDAAAAHVASYFDGLAASEWERHDVSLASRVSFELHRRMLHRHVRPGIRVLEVGAGPGRFTRELAMAGARITVADLSPVQLKLNESTMHEAGMASAVEEWVRCDIRDVSHWRRGEFDMVVAFGGPISYTFEHAEEVTAGLVNLLVPESTLLASVMSTLGSWRIFFPEMTAQIELGQATLDTFEQVLGSGDTRHLPEQPHICRTFRAHEFSSILQQAGTKVIELMASAWYANQPGAHSGTVEADPARWQKFVDLEERACTTAGAVDGGTHLLATAIAH